MNELLLFIIIFYFICFPIGTILAAYIIRGVYRYLRK